MEKRATNIRWEKKYCISNVKITEVRSLQQSLLSFLCNACMPLNVAFLASFVQYEFLFDLRRIVKI